MALNGPTCIHAKVSGACKHKARLCQATLLACTELCHVLEVLLHPAPVIKSIHHLLKALPITHIGFVTKPGSRPDSWKLFTTWNIFVRRRGRCSGRKHARRKYTARRRRRPRGTRAEPVFLVLCGVGCLCFFPHTHPSRLRRQIVPRRRVCFRTALCLLLLGRELFKCSRMCQ